MKRSMWQVVVIAVFLCIGGTVYAKMKVAENIPADTKILARVKIDKVLASPMFKTLEQFYELKINEIDGFINQVFGFDPYSVKTGWILTSNPDKFVIILEGVFETREIKNKFGKLPNVTQMKQKGTEFCAEFIDEDKNELRKAAIFDRGTLALGDLESMENFLKVVNKKSPALDTENTDLKRIVKNKNHVAAVFIGGIQNWPDMDENFKRYAKDLFITANVNEKLAVKIEGEAQSEKYAKGIIHLFNALVLLELGGKDLENNIFVKTLLDNAKAKRKDTMIQLTSEIDQDSMLNMLPEEVAHNGE